MSREYAMSRVRDALEKADGNHMKAQRLLLAMIEKDQTLLIGLVAPHLQSIITHAITHADKPDGAKKSAMRPKKLSVSERDTGEFGRELLQSLKGGRPEFGQAEERGAVTRPGQASQKHIDTMRALAAKSKTPPKKK
ncbi:MAG: hypothetical protein PW788_01170 [Micavibrio sp.]|nr:hypothetical protein [Micavibrio sp.]